MRVEKLDELIKQSKEEKNAYANLSEGMKIVRQNYKQHLATYFKNDIFTITEMPYGSDIKYIGDLVKELRNLGVDKVAVYCSSTDFCEVIHELLNHDVKLVGNIEVIANHDEISFVKKALVFEL